MSTLVTFNNSSNFDESYAMCAICATHGMHHVSLHDSKFNLLVNISFTEILDVYRFFTYK